MTKGRPAYGHWTTAALNSAVFILFAFDSGRPRRPGDRRSFGGFGGSPRLPGEAAARRRPMVG